MSLPVEGDRDHQAALVLPLALPLGGLARTQGALHHPRAPDPRAPRHPLPRSLTRARPAATEVLDRARSRRSHRLARPDDLRPRHGPRLPHWHGGLMQRHFTIAVLLVSGLGGDKYGPLAFLSAAIGLGPIRGAAFDLRNRREVKSSQIANIFASDRRFGGGPIRSSWVHAGSS